MSCHVMSCHVLSYHIMSLLLSAVMIKQLAAWVILEDSFDQICAFLGQTFGE
jgi:hypothetical protein